ncbi:hypothetical protein DEA8626_02588 [Defluviimonas aquaemixtae]|uniref:DM13 domain-containing protein n=1 Tax=Albidovulum aquaemixtae TaxID=1542388 RepID=A0A2R8BJH7_9RHOB|nr:DM13 domain-containing protein [Defluviimonas aquaemixtae]SPH23524.1 hypothetical protein DEA8626_02588 [Defluviimonas aquaemixtae]
MISKRTMLVSIAALSLVASLGIAAAQGVTISSGMFEGASNHVTSGAATIVEDGGTYFVELGEDFSLNNGPDPRVALGKDGYDPETQLGPLASLTGAQRYEIPASIDVSNYNEVYIWCAAADVPLGIAKLQ